MDFRLDSNNDFLLDNGNITFADASQEALQRNRQQLLFLFGEYFLDENLGIPWFEYIFQKLVRIEEIDLYLKRKILGIPGNLELISYRSTVDQVKRSLNISYSVLTRNGIQPVSFSTADITNRR